MRLKDIDMMLGLNKSRTLRLPPVEVMEERISNAWRRFGFTEGQISMALEMRMPVRETSWHRYPRSAEEVLPQGFPVGAEVRHDMAVSSQGKRRGASF